MTDQDMTPRRAALIVVIGLVAPTFGVPLAEFVIWPSLVDPESIEQTVRNIRANEGAFLVASFAYLVGFVGDVLVAWAIYYLLRPVSRSLAALTAGFRAVQAVIAIGAALNLFTAFRLLQSESLAALGPDHLHAQVLMLLGSFGYEWSLALVIFGIHLGLLGYLVYRSGYIPRLVGVALATPPLPPPPASATSSTPSGRTCTPRPRSASSSPHSSASSSSWSGSRSGDGGSATRSRRRPSKRVRRAPWTSSWTGRPAADADRFTDRALARRSGGAR